MDHDHFDDLTRALTGTGTRRSISRLLAGGVLGHVAALLGVEDEVSAKAGRHKRHKAPAQHRQSRTEREAPHHLQAERRKGKGKKHHNKGKQPPVPDPPCPDGQGLCPDGRTCANFDDCCPGQDGCADGTCVDQDQCCPGQ